MPVTGAKIVARNITRYGGGFERHVNKTLEKVSKMMDTKVTQNMTLRDHSSKDFRRMDHPYALRHGQRGNQIHNPYWQVHEQTGKLLSSKKSGIERAKISGGKLTASAFVMLDQRKAPHALHVIFGTSKMIPRPLLIGSLGQVKKRAFAVLNKDLRDFNIGFRVS